METILLVVLAIAMAALATGAVVDAWINGSIFSVPRDYFAARADASHDSALVGNDEGADIDTTSRFLLARIADVCIPRFVCTLVTCDFCLSHWVSGAFVVGLYAGYQWCTPLLHVVGLVTAIFATMRISWIIDSCLSTVGRHYTSNYSGDP